MRNQISKKQNPVRRVRHQIINDVSRSNHNFYKRERALHGPTPAEQLHILDMRLGVGVGAKRERARLQKQMEGHKNV